MHPRGFHYLIFILMVKRILLLALISSGSNSRFLSVLCRYSVWVSRRGSVRRKGPPRAGLRVCVSLSPWAHRSGSQAVDLLPWIERGIMLILWVSTLQSWVIISQVGIKNPKVLIDRSRGFAGEVFDYLAFDPSVFIFSLVPHYFPFSVPFPPRIPRVTLKKVMATASVDSTIAAGLSVVRFPSSILCFRFSALQ